MRIEITKYTSNPNNTDAQGRAPYIPYRTRSYESSIVEDDMIACVTDSYLNEVHLKDIQLRSKGDFDKLIELLINAKESLIERQPVLKDVGYAVESDTVNKY